MKSETSKLPKGQGYPFKPSTLEAALAEAGVEIDAYLIRGSGDLFYAEFWPPNPNVPYERLYIRTGAMPIADLAQARTKVEISIIPALVDWITRILKQDRQSPIRREKQYLDLRP